MNRHLLVAGIAVAALLPSFAFAQTSCEQQHNARVTGTIAGAGIGALAGGAVAGRDDRTKGAIIGAIAGGVIGNQVTKPRADCAHAYGYYDSNGAWHANAVDRANAVGYFDRNGDWVDGAPNGYYDSQNRWVASNATNSAGGYTDRDGRWVPASASGYYAPDGQWIAGAASGYYDSNGRWVAGPSIGRYDINGRWMEGQANGHRNANGVWVADTQPGYYENGRWRTGPAVGYYDSQGRFVQTAPSQGAYDSNASQQARSNWNGAPQDFLSRTSWLERRVKRGMNQGSLDRRDGQRSLRALTSVRQEAQALPHRQGRLSRRDEARMMAKLDDINSNLRWMHADNSRRN
jgi:hypothetical protein